ncbi:hypothetical protein AcW1_006098 [Taiwanofungus camphoratus]|nr:hypothetical protein AcW2_004860 [Antrodia cinnamomea]KAI0934643.1 hypothetical protein AcV5_006418 [Antrodia cinnamomea]KAI0950073.1 hypothetical protein AcV7_008650 [Antrodia cinnamomea]KAI0957835.1 hypothetical protein AcW1_006098 [Antrodia cinnamomea]
MAGVTYARLEMNASEKTEDLPFSHISLEIASASGDLMWAVQPYSGRVRNQCKQLLAFGSQSLPLGWSLPPVPFVPVSPPPPMPDSSIDTPIPAGAFPPPVFIPAVSLALMPTNSVAFTLVRAAFVLSLPDEMSISTGGIVYVVVEYGNGWALYANLWGGWRVVTLRR